MDKIELGEDALLPHGEGLKAPFGCLNNARSVLIAPGSIIGNNTSVTGSVSRGEPSVHWKTASRAQKNMLWNATSSTGRSRPSSSSRRS